MARRKTIEKPVASYHVSIYWEDLQTAKRKGISLSEPLRRFVHELVSNGDNSTIIDEEVEALKDKVRALEEEVRAKQAEKEVTETIIKEKEKIKQDKDADQELETKTKMARFLREHWREEDEKPTE